MTERIIVISGGLRGIGAAISEDFYAADVRKGSGLRDQVQQPLDWSVWLDVLVNVAGISAWRPLLETDEAFWPAMLDTNFKSALFASQAAAHLAYGGARRHD